MLTADQLDALVDPILALYTEYENSIINDIARRLAKIKMTDTAAWQMQRLTESGLIYENALEELSKLTGKSETELRSLFENAGVKALKFDDAIYKAVGLNPLPLNLSPAMSQVLAAGLRKTQGMMQNMTLTTAISGQQIFIDTADLAYMQVSNGAMSYSQAIREAVKSVVNQGLNAINFSQRQDHLDVAMRRTVLTGVNQTVGNLQIARADELGVDLVVVSAHIGARNKGTGPANHESWQGKVYSRSGTNKKYPDFVEATGYGTGAGLCGWNCVLGDTLVSGPTAQAAYRRKYSGEIIRIRTVGNKELSITPNHPILTPHGWVAAGLLREGDQIICQSVGDGTETTSPNNYEHPTRIEDKFRALIKNGKSLTFLLSPEDFHGDGANGEVNVVFADGFLRNNRSAFIKEEMIESSLGLFPCFSRPFISKSTSDEFFFRSLRTTNSFMSRICKSYSLFECHPFQTLAHSVRSILGKGYSKLREIFSHQAFGNSDLFRNLVLPESEIVHGKKLVGSYVGLPSQINLPVSRVDNAASFNAILNGMKRAPILVGNELVRLSGHEEIDNIVFLERKSTKGSFIHVYNLETEDGWYFANSIVTHNCRHSFYPFFEGISENAYSQADLNNFADKTVKYHGEELSMYEATQEQRAIERKIRYWKRQKGALEVAGLDASEETVRVKAWQAEMRDFIRETKLKRQSERERIINVPKINNETTPIFYDWEIKDLRQNITTSLPEIDKSGLKTIIVPENVRGKLAISHNTDIDFLPRLGEIFNEWDYVGISPKDINKIEFYKQLDDIWFTGVLKKDKALQAFILTTFHRIYQRKMKSRLALGYLKTRK